jgi:hypothetical protein
MTSQKPSPWEQQPGETAAQYAHFCTYRDPGIERTLDAAYRLWHQQHGSGKPAVGGIKGHLVSGQWRRECQQRQWVARARAWDVELFSTEARDVALMSIRYLRSLALRGLVTLEKGDRPGSKTWKGHLETVATILDRIPHETIAALLGADTGGPGAAPGVDGRLTSLGGL